MSGAGFWAPASFVVLYGIFLFVVWRRKLGGGRTTAAALVGLAVLAITLVVQPADIVRANTPTGGDMGAHVLVPAYVRDHLLPSRLMGWSNDWYAGFPVLYFYFPLPAFSIVALDSVLPYGVAFKMVSVLGLILTPVGGYLLGRGMGWRRLVAAVAAMAAAGFVLQESFSIYGGNVKSTMAGEYSFSWSFAFGTAFLGLLMRDIRSRERGFSPATGLAMAGMVLSHVITSLAFGLTSLVLLLARPRLAGKVATTWVVGGSLAAFWAIPLVVRIGDTTDMNYFPLRGSADIFPSEIWPLLPLAVIGAVWALRRRPVESTAMLAFTLIPAAMFPFLSGKLWNGRVLPFWFFGIWWFAGLAVGLAAVELARRLPGTAAWRNGAAAAGAAALFFPALIGIDLAPGWAAYNFKGYEAREAWPSYRRLMDTIDALPPGRIMWEASNDAIDDFGTPLALMLFPYWSEEHPTIEGLLFESSLSTPFHFLNASELSDKPSNPIPGLPYTGFDIERGLAHLELFNVRYYVTATERARDAARARPELTELGSEGAFVIFELPQSSLVEAASHQPAVFENPQPIRLGDRFSRIFRDDDKEDFTSTAIDWYGDLTQLDHWLVEGGPPSWPRVGPERQGLAATPSLGGGGSGSVSEVVLEDHRISFRTTAIGVPHLIKVSFFPNWQAKGAEGPWRAAPAFMVVVPTQAEVELVFANTWAENLGMLITGLGLIGLVGFGVRRRLRSRAATQLTSQTQQLADRPGYTFDKAGAGRSQF